MMVERRKLLKICNDILTQTSADILLHVMEDEVHVMEDEVQEYMNK